MASTTLGRHVNRLVSYPFRQIEASHSLDPVKEVLTLALPKTVPAGTDATLKIDYSGTINDKMAGFYRSSYKDKAGKVQYSSVGPCPLMLIAMPRPT